MRGCETVINEKQFIPPDGAMNLWRRFVDFTSKKGVRRGWNAFIIIFFLFFVLFPTIYVLSYVVTDWNDIQENVLKGDSATLVWDREEVERLSWYGIQATQDDFNTSLEEYQQQINDPNEYTTVITTIQDDDVSFRIRYVYSNGMTVDSNIVGNISSEGLEPVHLHISEGTEDFVVLSGWDPSSNFSIFYSDSPEMTQFDTVAVGQGQANATINFTGDSVYFFSRNTGNHGAVVDSPLYSFQAGNDEIEIVFSPVYGEVTLYGPQSTSGIVMEAIWNSFKIAIIVTILDVIFGFSMAWLIVRKDFKGKKALNTLIDLPLAIPTAALGFSTALFWVNTTGEAPPLGNAGIVSSPFILMILLHIVFTFPYMVRSLSAILEEIDVNYEIAAETLGANRFTMIRTITLPLFKSGLATGMMLCLARSLSETGGTMIALATMGKLEVFQTAPVVIGTWKHARLYNPALVPSLAFASILLIVLSLVLLVIVKVIIEKTRFPIPRVFPGIESFISQKPIKATNYGLTMGFLLFLVLIPSSFILTYMFGLDAGDLDWNGLSYALAYSFSIAGCVTVIDLITGIPLAFLISRGRVKWLSNIMDVLVNVPLVVPTAALGFSLGLFFTDIIDVSSAFVLIVLAHVAFTYPLIVRNVSGALDEMEISYEEAARTLGAKPLEVFRRVVFPLVRPAILAGSIMAFTRSLGETGATLAVVASANTVPVFIVTLVKSGDYKTAAMACIILMVVSFALIFTSRFYLSKEVKREW